MACGSGCAKFPRHTRARGVAPDRNFFRGAYPGGIANQSKLLAEAMSEGVLSHFLATAVRQP